MNISWKCPGNVPEIPGDFSDISRTFPGKCLGSFPDISRKWKPSYAFIGMRHPLTKTCPENVPAHSRNACGDSRKMHRRRICLGSIYILHICRCIYNIYTNVCVYVCMIRKYTATKVVVNCFQIVFEHAGL